MSWLALYCAVFVALHLLPSRTPAREGLIGLIGLKVYRWIFSGVSLLLLIMMTLAYLAAMTDEGNTDFWASASWLNGLLAPFELFGFILIALGLGGASPTDIGGEEALGDPAQPPRPRGVRAITRHPVLVGVACITAAHLISIGDIAASLFFGALLIVSLAGALSIDERRLQAAPEAYGFYIKHSSILPFRALYDGVSKLRLKDFHPIDLARLAVAISAFTVSVVFHELIGYPAL